MVREQLFPSPPSQRLVEIDALRGIALLGILLVNIELMYSPGNYMQLIGVVPWTNTADQAVYAFLSFVAAGKFYPIFAFLFGLGYMLFMRRAEQMAGVGHSFFFRRTALLFLFGIIHMLFLWWGDILTWYALTSLLLPMFYRSQPKTMLVWALILLMIPLVLISLAVMAAGLDAEAAQSGLSVAQLQAMMETAAETYAGGNYADIFRQRLTDIGFLLSSMFISMLFFVLPMMLFGMHAAKTKWLWPEQRDNRQTESRSGDDVTRVAVITLLVGISFTLLKMWSEAKLDPELTTVYDLWHMTGTVFGDFALSFFYICVAVLAYRHFSSWKGWTVLAHAGRMSLSNYLLQWVVLTTIFLRIRSRFVWADRTMDRHVDRDRTVRSATRVQLAVDEAV